MATTVGPLMWCPAYATKRALGCGQVGSKLHGLVLHPARPTGLHSTKVMRYKSTNVPVCNNTGKDNGHCRKIVFNVYIYHMEGNIHMVQTCAVLADDPPTATIKTAESSNRQLVPHYAGLCCKNKSCEHFFWSLWWHFCKSLHPQNFPL